MNKAIDATRDWKRKLDQHLDKALEETFQYPIRCRSVSRFQIPMRRPPSKAIELFGLRQERVLCLKSTCPSDKAPLAAAAYGVIPPRRPPTRKRYFDAASP